MARDDLQVSLVLNGGVSLAVLSGLGLIAAAFLLALVYAWLCRAPQGAPAAGEGGGR